MKRTRWEYNRYSLYRALFVIGSTSVNVILAFAAIRFGLPLYLDTVGTVFIALIAGTFPAIMTAVFTNVVCSLFSPNAVYYILISVLLALAAATLSRKERYYKKRSNPFLMILVLSLISGVLGALFQWLIEGTPEFGYISETAAAIAGDTGSDAFAAWSFVLIMAYNFLDKGVSVLIAYVARFFIPEKLKEGIRNSGWMQAPPEQAEVNEIDRRAKKNGTSIRFRLSFMIIAMSGALTLIQGWVSVRMNFQSDLEKTGNTLSNAAAYASFYAGYYENRLGEFLRENEPAAEYLEKNEDYEWMYYSIFNMLDTFQDPERIRVYAFDNGDAYLIMDTAEEFLTKGVVGEKAELGERDQKPLELLLAGKTVEPQTEKTRKGYHLTVYEPIHNSAEELLGYTVTETELEMFSDYRKQFIVNIILVFSGFFILILGYGLWMAEHYLVYPIGSLEKHIDGFMHEIDDQEKLDESVRSLQKLDIRTHDEVQKLYRSICEMAEGTAEQMRNIRTLAQTNAKMQSGLIITMADMVERRDADTGSHVQKTAAYVHIILQGLKRKGYYSEKLTDKYISDVEMSAPLHDIGKINIPDSILNKKGKLTGEEYEILKTHTTEGKNMLENAISTVEGEIHLKEARNMAAYHHERWNGTGYPEGLHGQVIPLSARVMSVADAFDGLTSGRGGKPPVSAEEALKIMEASSGERFDPKCVEVFAESLSDIKMIMKKYQKA